MNILKNAVLLLLLLTGGYWLSEQYKQANALDNLIHKHIQTASVASTTYLDEARAIQGNNDLTPIESKLLLLDQHLQAGEHLEVLAKGQAFLEGDPDNLEILLRLGIVYLQEDDYALAYEQLIAVHQAPTTASLLQIEAAWYLALLQSQEGHWEQSQKYLQQVLSTHTVYRRSAEELIAEIEQHKQTLIG
ncbi:MAG: tetratricopeptide repeat protein [Aureispira sp.]